jgi:phosphatidylserine/phosphatidylglycerophosphate/cardiolipin synthase-like enzyme
VNISLAPGRAVAGGFVGTSNFDYRSNLYHNELRFFFQGDEVRDELVDIFEQLKVMSYRWGQLNGWKCAKK